MPSWNALPVELKSDIFCYILDNALPKDHEEHQQCLKAFQCTYTQFVWRKNIDQLDHQTGFYYLEHLDHGDHRSNDDEVRSLHQCLTRMIESGWSNIENLLKAAPDVANRVHERLEKEFRAIEATFHHDYQRFVEIRRALMPGGSRLNDIDAADGIRKEVMKAFCSRSNCHKI